MKVIVDIKEFKRVLTALKPFTKDFYPAENKMKYIYFKAVKDNQIIEFQALDGNKLVKEIVKAGVSEDFTGYINPTKLYKTLSKEVAIEYLGNLVTVSTEEWAMKHNQPEGEWYQTEKFINIEYKESITVYLDAKLLRDALNGISKRGEKEPIELTLGGSKEQIKIKTTTGIRAVLPMQGSLNNEKNY